MFCRRIFLGISNLECSHSPLHGMAQMNSQGLHIVTSSSAVLYLFSHSFAVFIGVDLEK